MIRPSFRSCPPFVALLAVLALAACDTAPREATGEIGRVDFPTSCEAPVQERFERGVALLHHMMYGQAEGVFREVADRDPGCAMAHWGVAMTQLHPLWAPPTAAELETGGAAVERARESAGETDEREDAYIDAIAAFFGTPGDFATRLEAWAAGQRRVYEAHPEDVDAGAFHALALLATAPKDDPTFAAQEKAGALLEELRDRAPEHPGLFHYTIHASDNPALAARAEEVARAYDKLAPAVPHALHMPSHIFVRLGLWPEIIDWNRRSAAAALEQSPPDATSLHYAHAIDYLAYAYLQTGRDGDAREALAGLREHGPYQRHLASAYTLAAGPARLVLERHAWEEAAALEPRVPEGFPWDDYPHAESITRFARGLGAARSGALDDAREAVERLGELHERLAESEPYWATLTRVQRTAVSAWIAWSEGDRDEALRLMREAADLEDSVDKHPITPGEVVPARELLGEMLLLAGRGDEALEAFEAALAISPRRLNALSGVGRAAEMAGEDAAAASYYERASSVLEADAPGIPRLERIRAAAVGPS